MSDLRTAAQQALEALELAQTDVHWELNSPTRKFLRKAEKTLRAALAQRDEPCPNCASLEAQNTELDRKLAELERAYENGYKAGIAHEREECAKLCEARFVGDLTREDMEARRCAAAIRARGNT